MARSDEYEASLSPPFYEGGHWALPAAPGLLGGMPIELR